MKKISISLLSLLALLLVACTEDYSVENKFVDNKSEDQLAVSDVTVTPAGATSIVIANYLDEDGNDKELLPVGNIQIAQDKLPAGSRLVPRVFLSMSPDFSGATNEVFEVEGAEMSDDGTILISPSALSKLYSAKITRKPDVATIYLAAQVQVVTNETTVVTVGEGSGKFYPLNAITFTPDAVELESHYYYIGTLGTDKTYEFKNKSGANFYDDPVVSVVIPASNEGWHWFRLAGESSFGDDGNINWDLENANKTSICPEKSNDEGVAGNCIVGTMSWHLIESDEYTSYRVTVDLLEMTYTIEGIKPILYYAGDANGWSFSPMAKGEDGWNSGFYYIYKQDGTSHWGFKFTPEANWDQAYGWSDAGEYSFANGGGNLDLPAGLESGFYEIRANVEKLCFELSPITSMSLIGDAVGGWANENDVDMTYDEENRCWTVTTDLATGEYKIRANHDWALSWGVKPTGGFSTIGGATNMTNETAGRYTIQFAPETEGAGWLKVETAN